jgi:cell division protein FtsB
MRSKKNSSQDSSEPIWNKPWVVPVGFFIWVLWISGIFGNSGLIQAYKLSLVKRELSLRISALEKEKLKLNQTYHELQSDSFVQEQAIRDTLGYVGPNELVFEIK